MMGFDILEMNKIEFDNVVEEIQSKNIGEYDYDSHGEYEYGSFGEYEYGPFGEVVGCTEFVHDEFEQMFVEEELRNMLNEFGLVHVLKLKEIIIKGYGRATFTQDEIFKIYLEMKKDSQPESPNFQSNI